jgi:protein O-mannosyl-transferase
MGELPTDLKPDLAFDPGRGKERGGRVLQTWHALVVVLAATFAAYARTLSFDFVYDDPLQIVKNPLVHAWRYVPRYFTEDVWAGVAHGVPGSYYRPVFLLWCRVNDAMFGNQPGLWHLTTIGAHLVATTLVYFLVQRLLKDRLAAGIAALVFGLHPAHLEGVAWISGVTEPLVAVFFIAAFLCYLKWRERKGSGVAWLTLSLILYALGMIEKETGVMLPLVIAAYEWVYGDIDGVNSRLEEWVKRGLKAARASLPFVLLWIPYLFARIKALNGFSHPPSANLPISHVLYTWPVLVWFWIRHLIAPFGLASFYDIRPVDHPGLMNFVVPGIAVLAILAALMWAAKRSRDIAFAAFWLIIPLLPVLDIRVFARFDFAHDRYLYLPSVGLAIIVALAIRKIEIGKARWLGYPAGPIACALLLAVPLGLGTAYQSAYLRNNGVFYHYHYLLAPNNPLVKSNYAAYLGEHRDYAQSAKLLETTLPDLPDDWYVNYNLGHDYYELNRLPEAVAHLTRATQLDPGRPGPFLGLGIAQLKMNRLDEAEAAFRRAIELQPEGYGFHFALGIVLKDRGRPAEALEQFKLELENNPDDQAAQGEIAEMGRQGSKGKR